MQNVLQNNPIKRLESNWNVERDIERERVLAWKRGEKTPTPHSPIMLSAQWGSKSEIGRALSAGLRFIPLSLSAKSVLPSSFPRRSSFTFSSNNSH